MPGTTFLPVAGPAGTILAMVIGLAVMLVIGYSVSYLMNRSPRTGGVYSYTSASCRSSRIWPLWRPWGARPSC